MDKIGFLFFLIGIGGIGGFIENGTSFFLPFLCAVTGIVLIQKERRKNELD
jgi:hypothetical protein